MVRLLELVEKMVNRHGNTHPRFMMQWMNYVGLIPGTWPEVSDLRDNVLDHTQASAILPLCHIGC
jgi:hypothetical protein